VLGINGWHLRKVDASCLHDQVLSVLFTLLLQASDLCLGFFWSGLLLGNIKFRVLWCGVLGDNRFWKGSLLLLAFWCSFAAYGSIVFVSLFNYHVDDGHDGYRVSTGNIFYSIYEYNCFGRRKISTNASLGLKIAVLWWLQSASDIIAVCVLCLLSLLVEHVSSVGLIEAAWLGPAGCGVFCQRLLQSHHFMPRLGIYLFLLVGLILLFSLQLETLPMIWDYSFIKLWTYPCLLSVRYYLLPICYPGQTSYLQHYWLLNKARRF